VDTLCRPVTIADVPHIARESEKESGWWKYGEAADVARVAACRPGTIIGSSARGVSCAGHGTNVGMGDLTTGGRAMTWSA
jgi:hypothetical protein